MSRVCCRDLAAGRYDFVGYVWTWISGDAHDRHDRHDRHDALGDGAAVEFSGPAIDAAWSTAAHVEAVNWRWRGLIARANEEIARRLTHARAVAYAVACAAASSSPPRPCHAAPASLDDPEDAKAWILTRRERRRATDSTVAELLADFVDGCEAAAAVHAPDPARLLHALRREAQIADAHLTALRNDAKMPTPTVDTCLFFFAERQRPPGDDV